MADHFRRKESVLCNGDERYYRICRVGFTFGLIQHSFFAIFFSYLDVFVLSAYNILSILLFTVAYLLNEKRKFHIALTFAYVEIVVHQILATIFIGWATSFHLFILFCIMLPLLTSRGHYLWKSIISGTSFVAYLLLFFLYRVSTPKVIVAEGFIDFFTFTNTLSFIAILVLIAYQFNETVLDFEEKLEREFQYARDLLLNILPEPITQRLGKEKEPIADGIDEASVLFADIVGFTEFAESTKPERLVEILDQLFSRFDGLCDIYCCEKIKTIGDAYMVASGVPEWNENHADRLVQFGFHMLDEVAAFNKEQNESIQIRIGIHSGPLVAGVIGRKKFSYDLWGDTVNTAARMESTGVPAKIQVTGITKDLCGGTCTFVSRGKVPVKGKGNVETYLVERAEMV